MKNYIYVWIYACVIAKSLQSCLTLCDPIDCRLPGSSVHGILQTKILEWVTMPSSRRSSPPRDWTHDVSCIYDIAGGFFITESPGKPIYVYVCVCVCVSACNVRDQGSIPGLGRSPGGGHGNPLQYSCLENPHGQRSLVGYSPWGCKEPDMTEWLSIAQHMYIYTHT